jgi:DNA-binding response OmpR family regulator
LRRVLKFQITEAGYKVLMAIDRAKTLEMFKHNDFDCVIRDLQVPNLSGL